MTLENPTHPPKPPALRIRLLRRAWVRWTLAGLVIACAGIWMARSALTARVEQTLVARLAERGIYLRYAHRDWATWHGLRLENVVLHRDAAGNHPVVEISAVTVTVLLADLLADRAVAGRWRTDDATLTLYDDHGPVTFAHVTAVVVSRSGQIEFSRLDFGHGGGLAAQVSGTILFDPGPNQPTTKPPPFTLDLTDLREALAVLEVKAQGEPFTIRGSYSADLRKETAVWKADLSGEGEAVDWAGLPLRGASVKAQLSDRGANFSAALKLTHGSANISGSRSDWESAPLLLAGTLTDARGRQDEFSASYDLTAQSLLVEHLAGKADLWELGADLPGAVRSASTLVKIEEFPEHAVKNLFYSFAESGPRWKVESLETKSPANVTIALNGEPLKIEGLEVAAGFADDTWKIRGKTGAIAWREITPRSIDFDATLKGQRIKSKVGLQLKVGSAAVMLASDNGWNGPVQISGTLTDAHDATDRFTASFQPERGTLLVSELRGRAHLLAFAANFPDMQRAIPRTLAVRKFPEIVVKDFSLRPGKPISVDSLALVTPGDFTATLDGRPLELDDVTGAIAHDGKAWQISRLKGRLLGGELSVDGTFDGAQLQRGTITAADVHLAQFKPWWKESPESIGDARLSFDYRGTAGREPSQWTGEGKVKLDNASVVKVPLLDQTYALFSALSSPLQRRGTGQLEATFSATNGVAEISQFTAKSDALTVTAKGTLDLKRRQVEAQARGSLRGIVGLATAPLSRTLEMQVSGPLDDVRVRPTGWGGILTGTATILPATVKEASKLPGNIVKEGVSLPIRVLGLFKGEASAPKR